MITITCDWCHREFQRHPSKTKNKKHLFCSRECMAAYSNKAKNPEGYAELKDYTNMSQHMSELNRKLNSTRMTDEVREKIRSKKLDTGERKTYRKINGRHEHRQIAEEILGRPLEMGEVVHHIDGNKRNNNKDNLIIFSSQSEHARHHAQLRKGVVL